MDQPNYATTSGGAAWFDNVTNALLASYILSTTADPWCAFYFIVGKNLRHATSAINNSRYLTITIAYSCYKASILFIVGVALGPYPPLPSTFFYWAKAASRSQADGSTHCWTT